MSENNCSRRTAVAAIVGSGLAFGLSGADSFAQAADPVRQRPKSGDQLVYSAGPNANKPIVASDVKLGVTQVLAWPMDPASKTIRNGSRLNTILVVAVDPTKLSDETKANAAGGVVAYSAVCTHQGCIVEGWEQNSQLLLCPCHQSEYDPRNGAKVTGGPAPNRLATLPITVGADGILTVAGSFAGHVGVAPTS